MDVLSDAVAAMRTGRSHSSRTDNYAPWGTRFPASAGSGFHVVLRGSAWLLPPSPAGGGEPAAPVALSAGDVVFLAHGRGHALASEPSAPLEDFALGPDGAWPSPVPTEPPDGSPAPHSVLLCGAYQLDRSRAHPLLADLPDVVHLPARVGAHRRLNATVELLGAELAEPQPGSYTVVSSLLDTLLLYILRAWWLGSPRGERAGWAAALADPPVAAALRAVHERPAHPWTVEELGAYAGLSRAAFARRFQSLVGRPPMAYLTWWRMTTAGRLLRTGDLPLRAVAERTGYTSEFAFAKAFKREYGMAPGHYRAQSAGAPARVAER